MGTRALQLQQKAAPIAKPIRKTIAVDEEGFFKTPEGLRLEDPEPCKSWLAGFRQEPMGPCTFSYDGEEILVEPFDKPYVAQQVYRDGPRLEILMPYGLRQKVKLSSLCLDEWDRFHGLTLNDNGNEIPFVMTRKAQAELFSLLDAFDDDSVTLGDQQISTPAFYKTDADVNSAEFWTEKYRKSEPPRWDMKKHQPAMDSILPQLKLLKGRFLVPGCGRGHDANRLAQIGHIVEAIDISQEALEQAKDLHPPLPRLQFLKGDIFAWPETHAESYDYIFEHTCFCAISPSRRKELIKSYFQCLDIGGHLLGIFFVHAERGGPPYGCSEWELKELLKPYFDVRYWTRSKVSEGFRQGIELIVYAEKKKR